MTRTLTERLFVGRAGGVGGRVKGECQRRGGSQAVVACPRPVEVSQGVLTRVFVSLISVGGVIAPYDVTRLAD